MLKHRRMCSATCPTSRSTVELFATGGSIVCRSAFSSFAIGSTQFVNPTARRYDIKAVMRTNSEGQIWCALLAKRGPSKLAHVRPAWNFSMRRTSCSCCTSGLASSRGRRAAMPCKVIYREHEPCTEQWGQRGCIYIDRMAHHVEHPRTINELGVRNPLDILGGKSVNIRRINIQKSMYNRQLSPEFLIHRGPVQLLY